MTKAKKMLTLADLAGTLNTKPLATETFEATEAGLRFKLRSLSEAEVSYMAGELQQFETEGERELAGTHLAIALAVKGIEKKIGKSWQPVHIDRIDIEMLGETFSAIPLEDVQAWSLLRVKAPLSRRIMEITDMAGGEALKLELFRPGRADG